MCMSNVKPWPKDKRKPTSGWKAFAVDSVGNLHALMKDHELYKRGKWYTAMDCPGGFRDRIPYKPGFHVFLEEKDVREYLDVDCPLPESIQEVRVQGVQDTGTTHVGELTVFTCGKMMIPKERKRRKK